MHVQRPSADPRPAPPALRIHHLLACAAVAAVQLTYWRLTLPAEVWRQFSVDRGFVTIGIFTIGHIVSAAGLTFAILAVIWHFTGYAALAQPGQWLLLPHLLFLLRLMYGWLYAPILQGPPLDWSKNILLWQPFEILTAVIHLNALLIQIAPALLYAWCAWKIAETGAWRILFVVIAVLSFVPLGGVLVNRLGMDQRAAFTASVIGGNSIELLLIAWAAAGDWLRRRRFWTHWLGVWLFVASQVLGVMSGILFWLAQ